MNIPNLRITGLTPTVSGNSLDAVTWEDNGVRMGEGFIDALTEPLSLKDFIVNESRLEHGKRITGTPKIASREVVLCFTIEGSSPTDFRNKKNKFLKMLYSGPITLEVPKESEDVYRLIYTGKGSEYGVNIARTFCKMMLKFEEPNPADRRPRTAS